MKYFGTDGIRAVAGEFPLTRDFVRQLGRAAVLEIAKTVSEDVKKEVLIAMDGRESGPELLQWLSDGIVSAGYTPVSLGVAPTPAVSYLVRKENCAFGAVISASHNPAEFNGIKFFDNSGRKLDETMEEKVECALAPAEFQTAAVKENAALVNDYVDFLASSVKTNFKGKKIVLDCANGATYKTAPALFERLGAEVILMNAVPDGQNINKDAGALYPGKMQEAVKQNNAFAGFSFDGDGDRVIAADSLGRDLDGDVIISSSALLLKERGLLKNNTAVLTIMANLSVINFLKDRGFNVPLTGVGDKYVSQEMEKNGYVLGGETSGHIIMSLFSPTGDGVLAAAQFLAMTLEDGKDFIYFKDLWKPYPSKLTAVRVAKKVPLEEMPRYTALIEKIEADFNGKGRVVARYSGTEPKFRILVEGEDAVAVETASKILEEEFKKEIELCS